MAKPKHGRRARQTDAHPTPSSSSLRRFPSKAVLSALAVIATTPCVVAGSPLPTPTPPPEFLCPFVQFYPSSHAFPTPTPSCSTSSPTPAPSAQSAKHQVIADRYAEGSDRLWRKISSWTLYGSTCCPGSMTASSSTQTYASQTPTPTSTSTSPSTTAVFDTSALPAGWNNANSSSTESTTILALAIVLAGSICVFILGCLIWRRRKKRARDIERKLGHKHDNSSGDVQEKDARGRMRMWAKASARWKSNIHQSARRRRKRPLASSAVNRPASPTLYDSQVSLDAPSPPSRRSSLSAEEPPPVTVLHSDDSSTAQHDPPRPLSPPTYGASFADTPSASAMCNPSSAPPPDRPRSAQSSNQPSFIDDEPLPYIPLSDGHVAMDDKSHLARIQELASSPPALLDEVSESTMHSVSAPGWHEVEDDPEDLDLSEVPMALRDFVFPPSFPPPPKSDVSFGYLDDHPLRYGNADDILVSPIPGPSGSFLGASPSAPPIDYPSLEPSAPSLDDLFQDWDAASSYVPDVPTSADQDSNPACATDSSTPPAVTFTSHNSLSRVVRHNSILPQYHP